MIIAHVIVNIFRATGNAIIGIAKWAWGDGIGIKSGWGCFGQFVLGAMASTAYTFIFMLLVVPAISRFGPEWWPDLTSRFIYELIYAGAAVILALIGLLIGRRSFGVKLFTLLEAAGHVLLHLVEASNWV